MRLQKTVIEVYNDDNSAVDVVCRWYINEFISEKTTIDDMREFYTFDEVVECDFSFAESGEKVNDIALLEQAKQQLWDGDIYDKFYQYAED